MTEERKLDLTKVKTMLEKTRPPPGTKLTVVISSGAHAPVHLAHVTMFEKAKAVLEATPHSELIVGGFVAPSSDSYVRMKLGKFHIPLWMRATMVQMATRESNWITGVNWGWANGPAVAHNIEHALSSAFQEFKWTAREIHGADVAIKHGFYEDCNYPIVILGRPGHTAELKQLIAGARHPNSKMVIIDGELEDISSTAVREAVCSGDEMKLKSMLHPDVADYMLKVVRDQLKWV